MDMTLYEEIYAEKLMRLVQKEKPKAAGWAGRKARSQNKRPQTKPDEIGILILDELIHRGTIDDIDGFAERNNLPKGRVRHAMTHLIDSGWATRIVRRKNQHHLYNITQKGRAKVVKLENKK